MTNRVKDQSQLVQEQIGATASTIAKMIDNLMAAPVQNDMSNEWASLADTAEDLEIFCNCQDIDDELIHEITGFIAQVWEQEGEDAGTDLHSAYDACKRLQASITTSPTYEVSNHNYTQAELIEYLVMTVELMKSSPGSKSYHKVIDRKMAALFGTLECPQASFTAEGFLRVVSDLALIAGRIAEGKEIP